jgi:hypothetical protein
MPEIQFITIGTGYHLISALNITTGLKIHCVQSAGNAKGCVLEEQTRSLCSF